MRKDKGLITRQREVNLRHQDESCHNCRYFRVKNVSSFCLFLHRELAVTNTTTYLFDWAKGMICDAWKKRPKSWKVVATEDPYWFDRYITRQTQRRFRK